MNEDDVLLAHILSAHHAKAAVNVIAALRADYPLTAEHKRALADHLELSMRPRTIHDRGRKKARPLDGTEKDHLNRATEEVREMAKNFECTQKLALEILAGARPSEVEWDDPRFRAEKVGFWRARAAAWTATYGKKIGDQYDYSRFVHQIAVKLHLD